MNEEYFYCKGREIAHYLIKNGATLLHIKNDTENNATNLYVFEKNYLLMDALKKWEKDKQRCLF